jgi:hypothetical protein
MFISVGAALLILLIIKIIYPDWSGVGGGVIYVKVY